MKRWVQNAWRGGLAVELECMIFMTDMRPCSASAYVPNVAMKRHDCFNFKVVTILLNLFGIARSLTESALRCDSRIQEQPN